jgi:phage-related minor tail protein
MQFQALVINPIFRGAKAKGGSVRSGGSYLVGERGPELFMPARSGTIIPNNNLGGKGITNNIVVNVDASGTAVQGNDAESNEFGEQLAAAIQAEIVNQKRSGGLLN